MNLPGVFSSSQHEKDRLFLALEVGYETVTAGLWMVHERSVMMIKTSSPIEWEGENPEDVVEAADVSIEELGKDTEQVHDVILGLPEDWVDKDGITAEHKKVLKLLCDKLMLKPVGFVVTTESLVQFLREQEGGVLNAVLVQYHSDALLMSLVHAGKTIQTELVGRSTNSVSDVLEGLTRFKQKQLPGQVLLLSDSMKLEELEQEKQALLTQDWQKVAGFLHVPSIDVLPQKILIEAVCVAGGSAVARSLGMTSDESVSQQKQVAVGQVEAPQKVTVANQVLEDHAESFGFHEAEPIIEEETSMQTQEIATQQRSIKLPAMHMPKIHIQLPEFHWQMIAGLIFIPLAAAVIGLFVLRGQSTAMVSVTTSSDPVSGTVSLTLDPNVAATDASTNTVKVEQIHREVSGTKTGGATGSTTVGDRAKGTVTMYNASSGTKIFPAGTILTGPNKLKFTLDTATTIASSSGSASDLQAGKADVAITASSIGANSNLPEKTEFLVANFDKATYVASNNSAITGGTSRTVQIVSKEDQKNLEQTLLTDLKQQALTAIKAEQQASTNLLLLDAADITSEKFSVDAGKEAQTFDIQLTVTAHALAYTADNLFPIAQTVFKDNVVEHTSLQKEKTLLQIASSTPLQHGAFKIDGTLSSSISTDIDSASIQQQLAGKTLEQAQSLLRAQPKVSSATVVVLPSLIQTIFHALPKDPKHITVRVLAE